MLSKTFYSSLFWLSAFQAALTSSKPVNPPPVYLADPSIGPRGKFSIADSAHFRIYNATNTTAATIALQLLEEAHECWVNKLGWRSTGLSILSGDGPYYKLNTYVNGSRDFPAAGVQQTNETAGMAWLEVQPDVLADDAVTIHEYGHALHYHQGTWGDETNPGAWWEVLAQWLAETQKFSPLCESVRKADQSDKITELNLPQTIGDSYKTIVYAVGERNVSNNYDAWPFFWYLTENPDLIVGLGTDTIRQMNIQYAKGSNETPLHTLQRVVGDSITVAEIIGRYWARMAYLDFGLPRAEQVLARDQAKINYITVERSNKTSSYHPIKDRAPRYMGANIIPLDANSSKTSVKINAKGPYTATLVISGSNGVRYIDCEDSGTIQTDLDEDEECTFVIANTPEKLVMYDAFEPSQEALARLEYEFVLDGATVKQFDPPIGELDVFENFPKQTCVQDERPNRNKHYRRHLR